MELTEIKKIRKKLSLTQAQLANKAGLSQSLIAKIEAGTIDPTYTKAKQLFEVLNQLQTKEELSAKDIMYKKIVTVLPSDSVISTIKKMKKYGISQLPVVENNMAVGLISESTIIDRIASNFNITTIKVFDIMQECPPILSPNATKSLVLDMLKHYPILLVAENGKLKGIISKADVLDSIY